MNQSSKKDVALALFYDEERDSAPLMGDVATGELAAELRRTARRYGIPISRDNQLAKELSKAKASRDSVPEELYLDVARLFKQVTGR